MKSTEAEILRLIEQRVSIPAGSALRRGIGDDCAIYRPRGSKEDLLFTTDLLLDDVHFRKTTHSPEDVGYKALARGLSDIAAMGGEPRFCLLSLALPDWADRNWIERFYAGLLRLANSTGTPLAGGDLARTKKFACDITVCGAVPRGKALMRSGARPGDAIYVSGRLGGSALGLATRKGAGWKKHLRPEPRLRLGQFLRTRATAAMDLSDGLSLDLNRMCVASHVSAAIEAPPRFPGASLNQALHGGEDYELLFTARSGTRLPAQYEGLPLTRVGTITKRSNVAVLLDGKPLPPLGFDHFA